MTLEPERLQLALYQPDIAQNAGAMLRTCACFGVGAAIIGPAGFPSSDRHFRRAGMDYLDHVLVQRHDSWSAFEAWRRQCGRRLVLLTTSGDFAHWDFAFAPGDVILVGRESAGAPEEAHRAADARLRIAIRPSMRSLNVSVAAGIALSEAVRQLGRSERDERMTADALKDRQGAAAGWFESLQRRLIAALEALEDEAAGSSGGAGRFEAKPWSRIDHSGAPGGGGRVAMLRGRLFEKAGVHCSTVFGTFPAEFASQVKGAERDPRFWAAGLSLIAHPWSPEIPTVHMNTRFVVTTRQWFGGGADLTPMLDRRRRPEDADSAAFHGAMRELCARHAAVASHERFRAWCDEYFYLKHRDEPRGIGGIFYDDLVCSGGETFNATLAFTRDLGETFLHLYPAIVRANLDRPWSERDRDEQLVRRGRYVEFNLLYDRGTIFGLRTGGNVESILSSLPPAVRWP